MQHMQSEPTILRLHTLGMKGSLLATGTYHPLKHKATKRSPVDFRARRHAALYTHKNALCAAPSRKEHFHVGRSSFVAAYFYRGSTTTRTQGNAAPAGFHVIQQ